MNLLQMLSTTEIKKKIDENNKIIQEITSPNFFILNDTVAKLLAENQKLQKQCPHHFVNGYCDFCYKREEKDNGK